MSVTFKKFALASMILAASTQLQAAQSLNIYAWSSELPQEILNDFTAKTGIEVTLDTFDSNETLIAKLSAGASGYDLIEPSQYAVQILANKSLIEPLDHSKLPSLKNLSETFKSVSYDVGNRYSVPYVWGTTGLAYNDECVKTPVTSWKSLWDPAYSGRIYMLDNMLSAYIAALQVNGFKSGTSDKAQVEKATTSLIEQKKILGGYNSSNFADLVSSGEACIVQAYNSNISQITAQNPHVHYVIPEEGGSMWIDSLAVTKGSKNRDAAYQFIEYMLQPEVAAKSAALSKAATTVAAAKALLPAEIANNPAIYPDEARLKKADFILDLGKATQLYQDGWTRVKTAQ
ncbi:MULTISPECIES: ABC transporter substrate-binding protein [Pseudomonas]|uniref:Spermidine/putrescine ABC transporter substrate-binding protein n=1 Tax=Pseudomonas carnis TaxID=2487355 RepID=A0ABT5RBR5_9PSED|nr:MULTISPECIES: spermidine/putrescine ABC transporter substrate-binding protein [Pseudomonas]MDD1942688.1 spermidine/putrescine ABC transporter substrate-binding protein [Pseudomonas carnis]CAH0240415.1 Spermidine/putrescine-binding periplasmic protein [Pseudomonas carnis]CAH0285986.1 Spermidine/putrescine-binding periplasmic protein [Pseudomonas carnis]CAH0308998.1 Spermidine/putrescine-binding periplasmic protein [Pseudomonas carnis]CAH0315529.1 Spermidine/putrescine-binding periplasmic pro